MSLHVKYNSSTDTWLTPPTIINSCGPFDLDPCTPIVMPWKTAEHRYTIAENGLIQKWFGRVWLNPPYSKCGPWMQKIAVHNNGIALLFTRTGTDYFKYFVWPICKGLLFIDKRLSHYNEDGSIGGSAKEYSVLIAHGKNNAKALEESGIRGRYQPMNQETIIVVGVSPTWFSVVKIAVDRAGDDELKEVYDLVERIAPDKIVKNQHWKAKVRQQIQEIRKSKSVYHGTGKI